MHTSIYQAGYCALAVAARQLDKYKADPFVAELWRALSGLVNC